MQCPSCGGRGCGQCVNGEFEITDCPYNAVTPEIRSLIKYADFFKRGIPPISGGALEQASGFVEACVFLWDELDRLKA